MDHEFKHRCPFCGTYVVQRPPEHVWCVVCEYQLETKKFLSRIFEDKLEAERDAARARLADYEESYRRVLAEECAPDEQHCVCVPALRAEIARLEHRAIAAETAHESANALLVKVEAERDALLALRAEIKRGPRA